MWTRKEWPYPTLWTGVGNVSERRKGKCYGVLIKHCHKVKGQQVITLQMAQQLKTKNLNVAPGQLVVSVKLNFF